MSRDVAYGSRVRLRYATLVNFVSEFLSYAASLMFVILIARRLSVDEFGQWTLITRYVNYFLLLSVIYTYWIPRTISRGMNTAKLSLVLAVELGVFSSIVYLFVAYGTATFYNQPFIPLALAAVIVLEEFINQALRSIASAHAPQYVGISRLVLRFTQVGLAIITVPLLAMGLIGVVIAAICARLAVTALTIAVNKKVISRSSYSKEIVRKWLKASWLPLFFRLAAITYTFDVLVVRTIVGTDDVLAYYGVAVSIYGMAIGSTRAIPALYSRLLARKDINDVVETFWIVFMVNLPLVVGMILYADVLAYLYNPKYFVVVNAIRIFALASTAMLVTRIIRTTIYGLEERDADYTWSSGKLLRTTLFQVPVLNIAVSVTYLGLLGALTWAIKDPVNVVLVWGCAYLIYNVVVCISYDWLLRRELSIRLPYAVIFRYLARFMVALLPMVLIRFVVQVPLSTSIWALMKSFMPVVILSAVSYFTVLYVIDEKFRALLSRATAYLFKSR